MISSPKIKHPLQHNGTNQLERLISALIPENFKIDAHSLQDIIAATHSYAQLIQYYNDKDQQDGDWTCFWEVEPLTFLAIVSSIDTEEIVSGYQQKRNNFNQLPDEEQDEEAENQHALELIEYIKYLAKKVEHFYRLLPDDLPLKREILTLIRRDSETDAEQLATALHELIGYHKEAYPRTLADPEDLNHSHYEFFFSDHWEIKNPPAFYQIPFSTEYLARGFEKLEDLLKIFHQALVKIKKRAHYWFERNISQPQVREPHVALFLALLRLFEYAREDMNGLTREHLEYYYKRVLHLREASEVPDDVHLIFELANNADQYMVTSGTELLAGKDKNNRPLVFRTLEDWVISKAKVEEVKNSYLDFRWGKLFVNPDVKKKYCEQEELPNEKAATWRPMGDDQELPYGEIGFAIASPQLILQEGKRKLTAHFKLSTGISYLPQEQLDVFVSSEEEWLQLSRQPITGEPAEEGTEGSSYQLISHDLELKIGPMELARRIAADLVSDIGIYLGDQTAADPEVAAMYHRTHESVGLLNKYVLETAYNAIHILNQIIEAGDGTGEHFFLRAYFYWSLAKTFAPPLEPATESGEGNTANPTNLLKYTEAADLVGRSPFRLDELFDQIKTDLETAKQLLNQVPDINNINRYVVSAFLARYYLQVEDFARVSAECAEIINSGIYSFGNEPGDVFSTLGDENPGAIWSYEIHKEDLEDIASLFNWRDQEGKISSRRSVPLSDAYLREIQWIVEGEISEQAKNDKRFHQLFTAVPAKQDPNFPIDTLRVWCNKYHRNQNANAQTIVVLRYSEVVLNHMYALFRAGDVAGATAIYNELIGFVYENPAPVTGVTLSDIQRERAIELAFEGDRRDFLQHFRLDIPPGDRPDTEPLNWLSESLYFTPPDFNALEFSADSGITFRQLTVEATLQEDFPPVVAFKEPAKEGNINTPWPVLKLTLNMERTLPGAVFEELFSTELTDIELNVSVENIRENLVVHSDLGIFQGIQEFLPFGAVPKKGKLFRLGSAEALRKKLDFIEINFDWIDPPDFSTYDDNYIDNDGNTVTFLPPQLKIDFLKEASFVPQTSGSTTHVSDLDLSGIANTNISTISGTVQDLNGNLLENIRVRLIGVEGGDLFEPFITDNNGRFSFTLSEETPTDAAESLRFEAIEDSLSYYVINHSVVNQTPTSIDYFIVLRPFFLFNLIENDHLQSSYAISDINVDRYGRSLNFDRYRATIPQGFIQLEMVNGDFLHEAYPTALILRSIEFSRAVDDNGNPVAVTEAALPHPPYTPTTNGISLDYVSNQPILIGPANDGIDQFFHILPFDGYREVKLKREAETEVPLFYSYPAHDRGSTDFAPGNLFIGLKDLQPGSNLSLLIQMREGSEAEPDWQAPAIRWAYLTKDNQWAPFIADQILKDTSFGLTRTGLVQLMIPPAIVNETTLFEGDLYWLRAAAIEDMTADPPKSARALPRIVEIRAQVLEARFENRDNDLAHLAQPLPADKIAKLLVSRSEVKKIEQPFPSFNGRLPEKGNEFYRRVSERLRHKDRAVTVWDYERILLQQYPKIYRAKCLSHTRLTSELAPGHVLIAVIPDLKQRQDEYPVEPRFSRGDLREMEQYLHPKTNLFVAYTEEDEVGNIEKQYLWVVNPIYEPIRLQFDVRFRPGVDINFHTYVLDDDLKSFLAPWLEDRAADIRFNQSLHRSKIIQFIEERTYVDVVLNLEVEHCGVPVPPRQQEIIPTTSRSILTTHVEDGKDPERTDHIIRTFTGGDPAPC